LHHRGGNFLWKRAGWSGTLLPARTNGRSRLRRDLRKTPPVKGGAMARSRRRQCHALFEHQRLLDVAVEPESVRLEIGAVWARREQVHSNVMCAVAGHWK